MEKEFTMLAVAKLGNIFIGRNVKVSAKFTKAQKSEIYNSQYFKTIINSARANNMKVLINPIRKAGSKSGVGIEFFQKMLSGSKRTLKHTGTLNSVNTPVEEVLKNVAKLLDFNS